MIIKVCHGHYGQFRFLFAETFKVKMNIHFLFENIYYLLHSLSSDKILPICTCRFFLKKMLSTRYGLVGTQFL